MTKTLKITGMMCNHCQARVQKALEALSGVQCATVSHANGTAIVQINENVSDSALKQAVEEQGYVVENIE